MDWLALIVAGIFEAFGVMMINEYLKKQRWQALILFVLGFGQVSFYSNIPCKRYRWEQPMRSGPVSVLHAGTIIGMAVYGEPKNWFRISCIALIILSTIGLKLVS